MVLGLNGSESIVVLSRMETRCFSEAGCPSEAEAGCPSEAGCSSEAGCPSEASQLFCSSLIFVFSLYLCVSLCVLTHTYACPWIPEDGLKPSEAGVARVCGPPDAGARTKPRFSGKACSVLRP